jgi:16S rRNA (guanine966-N2)-methyltransferase
LKPPGPRVAAGALKGRRLEAPAGIRPSEGKVKEALFSIWSAELDGASFLDLFAGSGAVGVEAVSRGALAATFVESDRRALAMLHRNLALLPKGAAQARPGDVDRVLDELAAEGRRFELIFADPPYVRVPEAGFLVRCGRLLAPGGKIAFEHSSRSVAPLEAGDLVRIETRRYGEAALSFYGRS